MEREYLYYQLETDIYPFEIPYVSIRPLKQKEKRHFPKREDYDKDDDLPEVIMTLKDNGKWGEGLIFTISTSDSPSGDPIFDSILSLKGAHALHEVLGHFLQMRKVQEDA